MNTTLTKDNFGDLNYNPDIEREIVKLLLISRILPNDNFYIKQSMYS